MIVITLCDSTLRLTFLIVILGFVALYLEREWFLDKSPLPSLLIRAQGIKAHCNISCAFNALIILRHRLWQYHSSNFLVDLSEVCSCWCFLKHTCAWKKAGYAGLLYCLSYLPLTVSVVRGLENYDNKSIADNHMNFQILQRPPQTLTMYRVTTCHQTTAVRSRCSDSSVCLGRGRASVRLETTARREKHDPFSCAWCFLGYRISFPLVVTGLHLSGCVSRAQLP